MSLEREQLRSGRGTSTTYAASGITGVDEVGVKPVLQTDDCRNVVVPRAGATKKLTRAKPGRQFFLTIGFDITLSLCERLNLLQNLESFDRSNEIISYCIAQENSLKSEKYIQHIHCFVEFCEAILISDLGEFLRHIYMYEHIDIQPCRSKKSCLKYVSKEDIYLITNVKTSSLHFNYRCYEWACNAKKFDCTDPFVVEHRFNYKFLERYYNDLKKRVLVCLMV